MAVEAGVRVRLERVGDKAIRNKAYEDVGDEERVDIEGALRGLTRGVGAVEMVDIVLA